MKLTRSLLPVPVLLVCSAAAAAPVQKNGGAGPGSAGLGAPLFPLAGDGGYDVSNYALTLDYEPSANFLSGTAVITAQATQNLSRFDLDLRGFAISRLLVNGQDAPFARSGQELIVTPRKALGSGKTFTV